MTRRLAIAAGAAVAPLMIAQTATAEGETYIPASHAPDRDSWWNTIKKSFALAGEQMGVSVEYRNPAIGDVPVMARIAKQLVASCPNRIITTPGRLKRAIGADPRSSRRRGASHRQEFWHAGTGALGPLHSNTSRRRSRPSAVGDSRTGCSATRRSIPDRARPKSSTACWPNRSAKPDPDAVLTLGPTSADPTFLALDENGMAGRIYFGTVDLGENIVQGIKGTTRSGEITPEELQDPIDGGRAGRWSSCRDRWAGPSYSRRSFPPQREAPRGNCAASGGDYMVDRRDLRI